MSSPFFISLDVVATPAVPEFVILLGFFVVSVILEGLVLAMFKYENFGRSFLGAFIVNLLSTIAVGALMFTEVAALEDETGMMILGGAVLGVEILFMMFMKGQFSAIKSILVTIVMNIVSLGAMIGLAYLYFNFI